MKKLLYILIPLLLLGVFVYRAYASSVVIDSYSESNFSGDSFLCTGNQYGYAQTFTGNGATLTSAVFYMHQINSPSGNVTAYIYNISGTYGTNSIPSGTAIATSDVVDSTTFPSGSDALVTFTFSGANQITLANGSQYAVSVEYSGASCLEIGIDGTSPTASGNKSQKSSLGVWSGTSVVDLLFYVYGTTSSGSPQVQIRSGTMMVRSGQLIIK